MPDTVQNQYLVLIGRHTFDPAEARALRARRDVNRPGSAPDPNDTRIVQFDRILTGPDIERIRAEYGLALTAYVPNLAYVERVDAATRRRLGRDPLVRAVAAYRPEYKLDDPVVEQLAEEPGRVPIVASLFDGGSIPLVVDALEQAGAVDVQATDNRELGGLARVVFTAPVRELADLATRLPDVRWLELEPRLKHDDVNASRFIQGGTNTAAPVWDRGLHGEDQIIGMLEGNTPDIRHCFFADAAPNIPGPGHRKVVSLRNASIDAHATFVAGCAVGDERGNSGANPHRGSAWAAKLAAGSADVATLLAELTNNMNAGAFVHTNSWHDRHRRRTPAPYNQVAIDTDTFLRNNEEHVLLGSAGNTGEEQGPPGTAKNALCVAAADAGGTRVDDGNPGPTADGRRKPDIVAVGCAIRSSEGSACVTGPYPEGDVCATSWATPHAAGAAALVRQYFTEGRWATGSADPANAITPSGALIRAVLVGSAVDMSGPAGYPNDTEGWGILRLDHALMFSDNGRNLVVRDVRNAFGLRTHEDFTQQYTVNQASQQLRVVLAYTDPPGTTGAARTLVNNLTLRVLDPDGVLYVGNDFDPATGRSRSDSDSPGDAVNTIEVVLINNAAQGVWEITVHATAVTVPRQGFGLVITATEPPPPTTATSNCFVATAVYADPHHPDVAALRRWRDRTLALRGLAGAAMTAFSAVYGKVGPSAATLVRRSPRLRRMLRHRVFPRLVAWLTGAPPPHDPPRRARRGPAMAVTVESLALEVARAFAPLKDRLAAGNVRTLFAELGMPAPDVVLAAPGVVNTIGDTATAVGDLPSKIEDLVDAIEDGDPGPIVVALAGLTPVIASVTTTVDRIADAVNAAAAGAGSGEIQAFAAALPERLVGNLMAHYLERRHPGVAGVAELLGLLERRAVAATGTVPAYVERRLRLDRLGDLLEDPLAILTDTYHWGADLLWDELLDRLARFANSVAKVAFVQPGPAGGSPVLRIFLVDLGPTDDAIPGIRASTRVDIARKLDVEIPLRPGLALDVALAGDIHGGAALDLLPPAKLRVDPPATTAVVSGRARLGVAATGVGGAPVTLLGIAGGSGLNALRLRASIGSDLHWDVATGQATGDVLIEVAVEDGAVVIDLSDADGFLSAILPDGGLRVPFDILAGWSSTRGLYFEGGAGLAIDIPIDVELGPIKLQLLHLGFTISPDGLALEASGAVGAKLGPFALAIERMGTIAGLTFPATGGNLGPADIDFAFKPPSGIGLALNAGVVKGGGYLFLDPDRGEYSGILELSFGPVSIKAIGILTTKLPGGADGWALLLLVFGEFTAVQLGFGFTLNGVGGIIGLQHGVSIEALQSGLRTGVLDSVLFPRDPVANAPALIGQLRVAFPIVPRALTVGPALKLGWSTPALVTLSLGIILQFDDVLGSGPGSPSFTRVVLLGQLKVQVPPVDELGIDAPALIHLQVDILGAYDVPEQALSVDAVLRDSHIALLPITGSLVVRARFGDDPTFILAVGGFHPRFNDLPPGIPPQDRVGIQLVYGIITVRIVGYVAITSNTFQTGAEASLVAAGGGFRVEAYLGFDALFVFEPTFHFEIDFRVGASVRYKSISLASLTVRGTLSGPGRWEVDGHASISLFFFDIDIDFDVAWGEAAAPALPGVRVIDKIVTALSAPESWHAELPGSDPLVTLRTVQAGTDVLAHPLSSLVGVQKVVPLGIDIDRVGKSVPTDGHHFDITGATIGRGGAETVGFRDEHFARGEYLDLTEEEKLSTPSFERFRAGVSVATDDYGVPASAVVFDPQWETVYLRQELPAERHVVPARLLVLQAALGAVAQSGIHADRRLTGTKAPVSVGTAGFTVASATADVTVATGFATFTEAHQASVKATGPTYVADLAEREMKP